MVMYLFRLTDLPYVVSTWHSISHCSIKPQLSLSLLEFETARYRLDVIEPLMYVKLIANRTAFWHTTSPSFKFLMTMPMSKDFLVLVRSDYGREH